MGSRASAETSPQGDDGNSCSNGFDFRSEAWCSCGTDKGAHEGHVPALVTKKHPPRIPYRIWRLQKTATNRNSIKVLNTHKGDGRRLLKDLKAKYLKTEKGQYLVPERNDEGATELKVFEKQAQDLCLILAYESYAENVKDMLEPWERHLAGRGWALGDRLTYVDFLLYEGLDWHREFKTEAMELFPAIGDYLERFEVLPNVREYFASDKYKTWPIMGPLRAWGYHKAN
ncbi:glutathione S-transferase-like [Amblyomma americanum]